MYKKPLIVFEGIEGSGKTTHINFVAKLLKKRKKKFIKIREPGGVKNSEKIRKMILSNKSNFNNLTDLFLYMAARSENIEKLISKNYKKRIILVDRFTDSTMAYQHYGMGISRKIINLLNSFIIKKYKPNFTFINIVNKKNLVDRLKKRKNKNRYDKFNFTFYNKVQKGFLKISRNKQNYMIINSNNSIKLNRKKIFEKINKLI
tara:strand:+ start:3811 stop:4422 length:612 start_codon:yes stop_codon:yes gene_type:complete